MVALIVISISGAFLVNTKPVQNKTAASNKNAPASTIVKIRAAGAQRATIPRVFLRPNLFPQRILHGLRWTKSKQSKSVRYRARKQAAVSSVSRLLTRAVPYQCTNVIWPDLDGCIQIKL